MRTPTVVAEKAGPASETPVLRLSGLNVRFSTPDGEVHAVKDVDLAVKAHETPGLNHRLEVLGGILEGECRLLIQDFFKARRPSSGANDLSA